MKKFHKGWLLVLLLVVGIILLWFATVNDAQRILSGGNDKVPYHSNENGSNR